MSGPPGARGELALGLRANAGPFVVLVGVNALVGGMVGQERAIVPLLANKTFGLGATASVLTFLVAFGLAKSVTNLVAGLLSDRYGRKPVLVAGWLVGLPVPILLILAPDWSWVVAANLLLGINQGLTWSTTVLMKIDLVGPRHRGFALGINEASGYVAVAVVALLTGLVAESAGLRPAPFLIGLVIAGVGLGASALFVNETRGHADVEAGSTDHPGEAGWRRLVWRASVTDPSLSTASQAGFVNNLNDALAWGLLPLVQSAAGLSVAQIGLLASTYPATWGLTQIATGALSDRIGRKRLIVAGMVLQGAAIASIVVWTGFEPWLVAAVALGLGTAMVYPTLLAVVADVAPPRQRGSVLGVYRFWRDLGLAGGAIVIGLLADRFDADVAIVAVAALTAASGMIVRLRMPEAARTPSAGRAA